MFPSRGFSILHFTMKTLIFLDLIFMQDYKYTYIHIYIYTDRYIIIDTHMQFHFSICSLLIFQALFFKDALLSLLCIFGVFIKYQMDVVKCTHALFSCFVAFVFLSGFVSALSCFYYCSSVILL